nr:hypothetical protein [Halobellus litoreus]
MQAEKTTDHVSRIVFRRFHWVRGNGCEIHENAYWDLQTYLGLRESLAANEGACSFVHESTRETVDDFVVFLENPASTTPGD